MTQDEIIKIARRAYKSCEHIPNVKIPPEFIERFAKLVAQHEREACAKVCEGIATEARTLWKARYEPHDDGRSDGAFECVEAIRARGQA
jgi:hypothetical protein